MGVLRLLLLVFAVLSGSIGPAPMRALPAFAQDVVDEIDYEAWRAVATRAEDSIEAARASNDAFESLRSEIAVWRERFLRRQSANAPRIETLRGQLAALGDPPAAGETETEEIAARRGELNDQLARAQAPVARAVEAFSRAEGLVREIDGIIRERQTDALLKLAPTPLNPALWPGAVGSLLTSLRAIGTEVVESWNSDAKRSSFQSDLPITILYLLIAALLLARGRSVMERMTGLVLETTKGRARSVAGFVTSLGQIIVPVVGIVLLVAALNSTGLIGLRGQSVTDALPLFGMTLFGARWLGLRIFPKRLDMTHIVPTISDDARFLRIYATSLGLVIGLALILGQLAEYESYRDAVRGVLQFPLTVLAGFLLFRVGRVLLRTAQAARAGKAEGDPAFGARFTALIGRAVIVISLLGIGLTAVGFLNAGLFLIHPAAFSLAMLGLLLVLHDLISEIYAVATKSEVSEAHEALVPTLLSLMMVLLSLPVFALFWGARVADLTELWAQFRAGFSIGDTTISPSNFLTFAIVFAALYLATRLIQSALRTSVLPKTRLDSGGQTAIISGIGYVGIFLAAVIAITTAGIDLSSLAIVAGALSVGIGFGLQNIVSNFVSGIILLIERPISQGDWIEVGGQMGIVKEISVRSTRIETFDRTDVIVPNADFVSGVVQNWTRGNTIGRVKVPVGVAYGTDTRKVDRILKEIAMEHPLVTIDPAPGVDFVGFGADSLDFQIRAVIRDVNFSVSVKTELNHRIAERFAEEGIEIPFAQRDIWLRNPEALKPSQALPEPAGPSTLTRDHIDEADMGVDTDDAGDAGDDGDTA